MINKVSQLLHIDCTAGQKINVLLYYLYPSCVEAKNTFERC